MLFKEEIGVDYGREMSNVNGIDWTTGRRE
jgi:hypothetical protein